MRVGKKCGGTLLTVATIASVVTGFPHAVADDRPSLQATSTTPWTTIELRLSEPVDGWLFRAV